VEYPQSFGLLYFFILQVLTNLNNYKTIKQWGYSTSIGVREVHVDVVLPGPATEQPHNRPEMKRTIDQPTRKKRNSPCPGWCNYHLLSELWHTHVERCRDCGEDLIEYNWSNGPTFIPPVCQFWCWGCMHRVRESFLPNSFPGTPEARVGRLKNELKAAGDAVFYPWLFAKLGLPQPAQELILRYIQ
jgi:hypothetical protein